MLAHGVEHPRRLLRPDLARPRGVLRDGRLHLDAAVQDARADAVGRDAGGRASLAVARLAGHRLPGLQAARPLLRHRHHRGGRDRADAHDQLGLGGRRARALRPHQAAGLRPRTSSSTRQAGLLLHRARAPAAWRCGSPGAIERSRIGYYFRAIREDQDAAASLGIPWRATSSGPWRSRRGLTALGGTFYAQYILFIDPESVLAAVAVDPDLSRRRPGRRRHALGPAHRRGHPGAARARGRASTLGGTGKAIDLLIYGALIMLISVIQPGGIMALARRGRRTDEAEMRRGRTSWTCAASPSASAASSPTTTSPSRWRAGELVGDHRPQRRRASPRSSTCSRASSRRMPGAVPARRPAHHAAPARSDQPARRGPHLPEAQAVRPDDRARERHGGRLPEDGRPGARAPAGARGAGRASGSPTRPRRTRACSPRVSASASSWRARWRPSRASCSSTR